MLALLPSLLDVGDTRAAMAERDVFFGLLRRGARDSVAPEVPPRDVLRAVLACIADLRADVRGFHGAVTGTRFDKIKLITI